MRLSKNFTLEEFLISQTAARQGIDMTPPDDVLENLQCLVDTCLQPLRDSLGSSIQISSGYRPPLLNSLIGGSVTSAHMSGRAADLLVSGYTPLYVCRRVTDLGLPFDQIIHEFGRWSHLGIADDLRSEALTAYRLEGRTHYAWGHRSNIDFQRGSSMTWERIKAAARTVRQYLWIIVSGVVLAALVAKKNHHKRQLKKNQDKQWRHRVGSVLEDQTKSDDARELINKHDTAAAQARKGIRRKVDAMANADHDVSNILDKWNSDRLRRDSNST